MKKFIGAPGSPNFGDPQNKLVKAKENDTMVSHEINICENKQSSTCVCMVKYLHVVHKGSWWLADVYDAFRQTYMSSISF